MKLKEFQTIYADVLAKKNNTPKIHRTPRISSVGSRVQAIISDLEYNSVKPDAIDTAIRLCNGAKMFRPDYWMPLPESPKP